MTNLERFWLDLMQGRRHIINEVYGNEAMMRYKPHPREKELFLENNGRVPHHTDIAEYNHRFWKFCEERYSTQKAAYQKRIADNARKSKSWPLYKEGSKEREILKQKVRDVILGHAKGTNEENPEETNR